jgi:uncharacterized protein YmfQ (DUF2313 family)
MPILDKVRLEFESRDRHARRNGDDYGVQFLTHLPTGQAWPRYPDSTLVKACNGLTYYWGHVHSRAADLLEIESDPRKTVELLPEWERAWGLPDPCFPDATSIEDRRNMLVFKMTLLGGQSREFFEKLTEWTGQEIDIGELSPFMCGISEVGDTRYEYDDTGEYRWYLGDETLRFFWSVRSDDAVLDWFRCGRGGGELGVHHHLEIIVEAPLDCLLQRWKPAHTQLTFSYESLQTEGPWAGLP